MIELLSLYIPVAYIPYVLGALVAAFVMTIGVFIGSREVAKANVDRRLRRGREPGELEIDPRARASGAPRLVRERDNVGLAGIIRRILPNPDKLRLRLERTGRAISLTEFSFSSFILMLVASLGIHFFARTDLMVSFMCGILLGLILPNKIIMFMGNRRIKKFMKEFPAAIDMIVRGLRSGLPFAESVAALGREFPDPIGIEFRRVADSVKLGQSIENALWDVANRVDVPEFKFMIVSMTIQRETGGNLAETLSNLADLLRKRQALKLKIRALSSEARASAYIIGSLPFLMMGVLSVMSPGYLSVLFTEDRGQTLLLMGGSWMFLGFYVMWQMVNFEY